jgi:predicted glycogen debranching enzyme
MGLKNGGSGVPLPSFVNFGREISGDLAAAESREWLVTNGAGGFASGTVAGHLARRYHGLLVAALDPPLGRTLLVSKIDEIAECGGESFALGANRWAGGAVDPQGFKYIQSFRLEGSMPVWTYARAEALIEKRVWMEHGKNISYVRYDLARGEGPVRLSLKVLVNYRDFYGTTTADGWRMNVQAVERGIAVGAFPGAVRFYLQSLQARGVPAHEWYKNFDLTVERYRGLSDREDHLHAATFTADLKPGARVTLVLSAEANPDLDGEAALERERSRERALLASWAQANLQIAKTAPSWIRQLVLAADQFLVRRTLPSDEVTQSIIAGYHWFGDWGRDTMVSLPGLTLATGRPEIARSILQAFGRFVDGGMLPNFFPESGQAPEYNTVDAALWYVAAVREYYAATSDDGLIADLFPVLAEIIRAYSDGTRFSIHADPADGLIAAGEPGVQLTWMDAKAGDWVVTPRIGKPVEVNALWLNALASMAEFCHLLGKPGGEFERQAERVRGSFQKFWNSSSGFCYDVIDGPEGNDDSFRPNQIFSVSLPESPLAPDRQRAVVYACARRLLTSHGLRSLAPDDRDYAGTYGGKRRDRDAAYHQGTVWGWLLGPFALAHFRVYRDAGLALSYLEPMRYHIQAAGLGTASEIFDGDAPFAPRGCIAQAWTVAEILRAWRVLSLAGVVAERSRT